MPINRIVRSNFKLSMFIASFILLTGCGEKSVKEEKSASTENSVKEEKLATTESSVTAAFLTSLESKSLRTGVVEIYVAQHGGKLILNDKKNNNVRILEPTGPLDYEHKQLPIREIIYSGYNGTLDQIVIDASDYACIGADEMKDVQYSFSFERLNDAKFLLENITRSNKCQGKREERGATLRDRLLAAKSGLKQSRINENMFLTKYSENGTEGFFIKADAAGAAPMVYAFDRKLSAKEREEIQTIAQAPRLGLAASDERVENAISELVENLSKPEIKQFNKILWDFTNLAQASLEYRLKPTAEVIEWTHSNDGSVVAIVAPGVIGSESCGNVTFTPRVEGAHKLWSYATTCAEPAQSLVSKWNERAFK